MEDIFHSWDHRFKKSTDELSQGQREARQIRFGVLGMVGMAKILDRLGYQSFLPTPEQDAQGKVDLWVLPKNKNWQEGFVGVQLKTSINGIRGVSARVVDEKTARHAVSEREEKQLKAMLHFIKDYGRINQVSVFGVWVDLTGTSEYEIVDGVTGEVNFDRVSQEDLEELVQVLEQAKGGEKSETDSA